MIEGLLERLGDFEEKYERELKWWWWRYPQDKIWDFELEFLINDALDPKKFDLQTIQSRAAEFEKKISKLIALGKYLNDQSRKGAWFIEDLLPNYPYRFGPLYHRVDAILLPGVPYLTIRGLSVVFEAKAVKALEDLGDLSRLYLRALSEGYDYNPVFGIFRAPNVNPNFFKVKVPSLRDKILVGCVGPDKTLIVKNLEIS